MIRGAWWELINQRTFVTQIRKDTTVTTRKFRYDLVTFVGGYTHLLATGEFDRDAGSKFCQDWDFDPNKRNRVTFPIQQPYNGSNADLMIEITEVTHLGDRFKPDGRLT